AGPRSHSPPPMLAPARRMPGPISERHSRSPKRGGGGRSPSVQGAKPRAAAAGAAETSEPTPLLDEAEGLVLVGHEVGASMPGNHDRAAAVSHPRRAPPLPALEPAVQEAAGEGIARAEDVLHLHREGRNADRLRAR